MPHRSRSLPERTEGNLQRRIWQCSSHWHRQSRVNASRFIQDHLAIRGLVYGIVAFAVFGLTVDLALTYFSAHLHRSPLAMSGAGLLLDSVVSTLHGVLVFFIASFLAGWFVFELDPKRELRQHARSASLHGAILGVLCSLLSVCVLLVLTRGISFGPGDWQMVSVSVLTSVFSCTLGTVLGTAGAYHHWKTRQRDASEVPK